MTASGQTDAEARSYADALQAFVVSGRHTPMTGFVEEGKYIFARRGMLIHCLPKTASGDLDAHIAGLKKTYDEIFDAQGKLKPSLPPNAQPYPISRRSSEFIDSSASNTNPNEFVEYTDGKNPKITEATKYVLVKQSVVTKFKHEGFGTPLFLTNTQPKLLKIFEENPELTLVLDFEDSEEVNVERIINELKPVIKKIAFRAPRAKKIKNSFLANGSNIKGIDFSKWKRLEYIFWGDLQFKI